MKHKIFEIGGCVRDELLGLHTKDIDFTVVIDQQDEKLSVDEGWAFMKHFLLGEGFKIFLETKDCFTIRAMFPKGHQHEGLVADFVMARKEVGYIPGTRKPILELGSLEDDMMRRDDLRVVRAPGGTNADRRNRDYVYIKRITALEIEVEK